MRIRVYSICVKLFKWPTLKIHCWGGLGSQLYALALYLRLSILFPKRSIEVVFHTGGVTERLSDLAFFFPNAQIIEDYSIGQFVEQNSSVKMHARMRSHFKNSLKRVLLALGFLAALDSEKQFKAIKPWVLAIRGHYSDLCIPPEVARDVYKEAARNFPEYLLLESSSFIGIHYRLGDLLELATKDPTDSSYLEQVIKLLPENFKNLNFQIFSDSPAVARQNLSFIVDKYVTSIQDGAPWEVILTLANAKIVIGTSSKLSIWSSIFALSQDQNVQIFMPSNLRIKLERNLYQFPEIKNVTTI